ncbi:MAG: phosphate transport system permease protein [Bryobacterales bacterium]|jgi:phosphate transport system permease protein|nr:phosphate transport system permease protein [Bryobacterales bacterium]
MAQVMTSRNRRRNAVNNVMLTLTGVCAVLTVSTLFLILSYLVYNGGKSLNLDFFTKLPLSPGQEGGGMANAILGSAEIVLFASLLGLPVGFLAGVYLAEFSPKRLGFLIRYTADLLNGVPSIVIGIFAWTVVVRPMHQFSALAGGFALSLMLIPITARGTEQFLLEVPRTMREGALALGAPMWVTIATVVVPAARKGIMTSMILGVARISGETAPLLFTALGNQFWSAGLNQPTASLPVMIFTHATAPYEDWHRQAWAAGLVLLGLVLVANISARMIVSRGASLPR